MLQYLNPRNANTKIVNAPQMAESISEGVLASYTKQIGDYVDLDEELALIETDNIDVAVNAPDPGIVTKLLVGEGDTVTVGQALIEIDVDAREKPTSSAKDSEPQRVKDLAAQQYSAEQKQQQSMAPAASSSLSQEASVSAYGDSSRAENKVTTTSPYPSSQLYDVHQVSPGQDDTNALAHSGTSERVAKHNSIPYNLQRSRYVPGHRHA